MSLHDPIINEPPALSLKPRSTVNGEHISKPTQEHENEWYRSVFSSNGYTIQEQPLHTRRPIRMLIIGAGAGGLQVAYKALRQLSDVTFTIYEKNADVGGTWLENRYPGCTCDIPSHSYQFTFWRKPDWKSYYAGAEEIRQYLKDFAVQNELEQFVKFRHKIEEARWNQDKGFPDIPGIQTFEGQVLHSAAWDDSVVLEGKKVAVVGGGSSAVQIIPSIQPQVGRLYAFLRSPVWITAGFGAKHAAPGGVNFDYSEEQKKEFERDPAALDKYCRDVEGELNKRFTLMHLDSEDQKASREYVADSMFKKLAGDPRLTSHLIPKYALGCRRMTPGSDYLQSLLKDNVEVISQSAVEVTPTGLIDSSGTHTEVDVIVFATGFDTSFSPSYTVVGQDGRTLRGEWGDFPKSYLSIMAEGFPNMFRKYLLRPSVHAQLSPQGNTELTMRFQRLSRAQRSCFPWISSAHSGVAYSLCVQGHLIHASKIHQVSCADSSSCDRLLCSHPGAAQAHCVVLSVSVVVQEWQNTWSSHGDMAW
ncbi:hypothetical protein CLAIMM_07414 isoform 1 [Cladophialophora immunda]|nr:hypothetical protein CLAIMM_07414 isoform 1 [Cladophialophora immunda]